MDKMTNREYYKEQILDIACRQYTVAVNKKTNKPCVCDKTRCKNCLFNDKAISCNIQFIDWCDAEYVEPCSFENDEVVEVSNDEQNWELKYFSHINPLDNSYGVCDTKNSAYIRYYKICRKYGTLGGEKGIADGVREFAECLKDRFSQIVVPGCMSFLLSRKTNSIVDQVLEEYEKRTEEH